MAKISIGMVLSQLLTEKNISAVQVADRIGKTRQNVYADLKRTSMRDEMILEYAKALDIDKQIILDRLEAKNIGNHTDSNYLLEHLASLEEQFKRLLGQLEIKDKQLEVKDQQMAGLQKTVEVLLGKFDVSENVTCSDEIEEEPEHVLNSLTTGMVA